MMDQRPAQSPDSPPDEDRRGSIETTDRPEATTGRINDETPDAGNGAIGGTDGITKNQDETAQ